MMRAIFDRLVREDLCKNLPFRKRTKPIRGEKGVSVETTAAATICVF